MPYFHDGLLWEIHLWIISLVFIILVHVFWIHYKVVLFNQRILTSSFYSILLSRFYLVSGPFRSFLFLLCWSRGRDLSSWSMPLTPSSTPFPLPRLCLTNHLQYSLPRSLLQILLKPTKLNACLCSGKVLSSIFLISLLASPTPPSLKSCTFCILSSHSFWKKLMFSLAHGYFSLSFYCLS